MCLMSENESESESENESESESENENENKNKNHKQQGIEFNLSSFVFIFSRFPIQKIAFWIVPLVSCKKPTKTGTK
jgi:hypothetical protein